MVAILKIRYNVSYWPISIWLHCFLWSAQGTRHQLFLFQGILTSEQNKSEMIFNNDRRWALLISSKKNEWLKGCARLRCYFSPKEAGPKAGCKAERETQHFESQMSTFPILSEELSSHKFNGGGNCSSIIMFIGYHFFNFLRVSIFCTEIIALNAVVRGVWGACPPVRA